MIFDRLENASLYTSLHAGFREAFDFLTRHAGDSLPVDRYEIRDGVYAMVQRLPLLDLSQAKWEAHRDYIDIQYVRAGTEVIGFAQIDRLKEIIRYSPERDIAFYSGSGSYAQVSPGEFMILFPHDAHKPLLLPRDMEDGEVEKIVVKVRI